jgi:hypothetical protein
VGDFIRHSEKHRNESGRKAEYMRMTCDELRCHANNVLGKCANPVNLSTGVEKRMWDETGMLEAKRFKMAGVVPTENTQQAYGNYLLRLPWLC